MNQTLLDAINAGIEAARVESTDRRGQLGYGLALDCVLDTTLTGSTLNPLSNSVVGQALLRRLVTERGSLPNDGNYGTDITQYLNAAIGGDITEASIAQAVSVECAKDPRVESTVVEVRLTGQSLDVAIRATLLDSGQAFDLVFNVTSTGQLLIERLI